MSFVDDTPFGEGQDEGPSSIQRMDNEERSSAFDKRKVHNPEFKPLNDEIKEVKKSSVPKINFASLRIHDQNQLELPKDESITPTNTNKTQSGLINKSSSFKIELGSDQKKENPSPTKESELNKSELNKSDFHEI
jgi:hypothetical protein